MGDERIARGIFRALRTQEHKRLGLVGVEPVDLNGIDDMGEVDFDCWKPVDLTQAVHDALKEVQAHRDTEPPLVDPRLRRAAAILLTAPYPAPAEQWAEQCMEAAFIGGAGVTTADLMLGGGGASLTEAKRLIDEVAGGLPEQKDQN